MRILIVIMMMWSATTINAQEIWQLTPWPPDSNYVLGALPSGEPTWVHKDSTGISGGVTDIFIEGDSLYTVVGADTTTVGYLYQGAVYFLGTPYDIKKGDFYKSTNLFNPTATKNQIWDGSSWIDFDQDIYLNNEGSLSVGAGTGTTSIINSNTSGSTGVTIAAGSGLGIAESGNVITLTNTSPENDNNELGRYYINTGPPPSGWKTGDLWYSPSTGTLYMLNGGPIANVWGQADWNETDSEHFTFIKNKPDISTDTSLISQIVSDSLATYVFETDTSLINQLISDSLATIVFPNDSTIVTNGTGISVVESPANTFTVTNTAPDQVVTITGASGTYPNFTVANPPDSTVVQNLYGTIITESPANTFNIEVDSTKFVTPYDLTLIPNPPDSTSVSGGYGINVTEVSNVFTVKADTSELSTPYDLALKEDKLTFSNGLTRTSNEVKNDLITGKGTTQTIYGGVNTGNTLKLRGNTVDDNGKILFGDNAAYNEAGMLGIGTTSPVATLDLSTPAYNSIRMHDPIGGTNMKTWAITSGSGQDERMLNFASRNDAGSDYNFMSWQRVNNSHVMANLFIPHLAAASGTEVLTSDTGGEIYKSSLNTVNGSSLFGSGNIPTYTLPSLSSGSVIFSNGGDLAQDNANFYWNNSTKRLSLGTASASRQLTTTEDISVNGSDIGLGGGNQPNNCRFGNAALRDNTTGVGNLAFGAYTMMNNTTGYYNSALGNQALFTNVSGHTNTAIGQNTLYYNTGSKNTGIGTQSLLNNIGGEENTGIGPFSLYSNVSGSRNIAIGYGAGYSETGSDKLYIDPSTTSTPLIGGNFSTRRIGINNTISDITRTLDVNGEVRIRDLTTTSPSGLVGRDANGVLSGVTLGTGLSYTGTTLNATGVTGSGTATRVAFWSGTSALSSSSNFFWDNSNSRLGIGTSSPARELHVVGDAQINSYTWGSDGQIISGQDGSGYYYATGGTSIAKPIYFGNSSTTFTRMANLAGSGTRMVTANSSGDLSTSAIPTAPETFAAVGSKIQSWYSTGTFGSGKDVGFGVDPTREIDVNGDARLRGAIYDSANSAGSSGQVLTSQGSGAWTWTTPNTGTVTSVGINTGGGVTSVSGSPVTGSGNISLTLADQSASNELQTISTSGTAGNITLSNGGGTLNLNINDADASTTNELQNLSLSGQSLGISSGTGVTLPIVDVVGGFGVDVNKTSGVATLSKSAPYSNMSINDYTKTLSTSYQKLAISGQSSTNGDGVNLTYDNTNNEIDITVTGTYKFGFTVNCKSNTAGHEVTFDVLNAGGGAHSCETKHYFNNTNEYCHNNMFWVSPITAPVSLSVHAKTTATSSPNINNCSVRFYAERLK